MCLSLSSAIKVKANSKTMVLVVVDASLTNPTIVRYEMRGPIMSGGIAGAILFIDDEPFTMVAMGGYGTKRICVPSGTVTPGHHVVRVGEEPDIAATVAV